MTDNVTARELLDLLKNIKPHVAQLTQTYAEAANKLVVADETYRRKEASAFLAAKQEGATNPEAERIAIIKSSDERRVVQGLKEEKAAARLGSDAWQSFLEAVEATGHSYNRELKTFATGERWGE